MDKHEVITMQSVISRATKIQGWMPHGELEILFKLAQKYVQNGGLVVEIGSWKGRSAYVLASICKERGARLICIDTFFGWADPKTGAIDTKACKNIDIEGSFYEAAQMGSGKFMEKYIKQNLAGFPVGYIVGDSTRVHVKVPKKKLDFCFIDGDHREPVISQDIKNFWAKLRIRGALSGHDYGGKVDNDVKLAVDKFFGKTAEVIGSLWVKEKT